MNPTRTVVDIHILQTLPPSCLNRDDTGAPKSALYGGARRARVSSQSWKRASRRYFNEQAAGGNAAGVRSRKLPQLFATRLAERLGERAVSRPERVVQLANEASGVLVGVKSDKLKKMTAADKLVDLDYALFISAAAIDTTVEQLVAAFDTDLDHDALRAAMGQGHSLDVALFGRMVADTPKLNIDAACQVAHAISTHRVSSEFDFYTTVDDLAGDEETGAAMMGFVEFASATMYRYATVNLGRLADNLGDPDAVAPGVRSFVEGFARSLPTGRQNTFAALTLPDLVFVALRGDQPISLVGAFETPVEGTGGYVAASAARLAEHANEVDALYDIPRADGWASYTAAAGDLTGQLGASISFVKLLDELEAAVRGDLRR